jgi:hypothetical protein
MEAAVAGGGGWLLFSKRHLRPRVLASRDARWNKLLFYSAETIGAIELFYDGDCSDREPIQFAQE